jgi:hypothetical protein
MGGFQTGAQSNVIDYVTIATTGNAADFGDMVSSLGHWRSGDMSSGHGGLS